MVSWCTWCESSEVVWCAGGWCFGGWCVGGVIMGSRFGVRMVIRKCEVSMHGVTMVNWCGVS